MYLRISASLLRWTSLVTRCSAGAFSSLFPACLLAVAFACSSVVGRAAEPAKSSPQQPPLVQLGFKRAEIPEVRIWGSAQRAKDGGFVFSSQEPWGRVESEQGVSSLAGLRSFTLMGWLRPQSLTTGFGGNRIVYCLNGGSDGFDLVCLADGRMRLAINQWPDAISDDSSAGKLQVGKWTFFAVTYDADAVENNVSWYFGEPSAVVQPGAVTVDKQVTYRAGRLGGNVGPIAVGNFNKTMESYGWDRQFRGEIRGLQLFGSQAGPEGAFSAARLGATVKRQLTPSAVARPRVIISTDLPPLDVIPVKAARPGDPPERCSDPDDLQSLVRFLLYTNELDVEGLIASAGSFANVARKKNIQEVLKLYGEVREQLAAHDSRYPRAETLLSITWQGRDGAWGSPQFGAAFRPIEELVGPDKDTEASNGIIAAVDKPDSRPVWFCAWGGSREVAQAIWRVKTTRGAAEFEQFLSKLRLYLIGKQDCTTQWLLDSFPQLFIILSEKNYYGMFWDTGAADPHLADLKWIEEHVRSGHGPLGAAYPRSGWDPEKPGQQEGDSPSFLHLLSAVRGINDPEAPDQGGWGGRFVRPDPNRNHWFDDPAGPEVVSKWRADVQADFSSRADWMVK